MSDSSGSGETRECKRCKAEYELSVFRVMGARVRDGGRYRAHDCRACHSETMKLMRRLHKTVGRPSPSCEICHRVGQVVLDHDHATGEFRGWLCKECNTGLGNLGDDVASLRRALAYLERARSPAASSGPIGEERVRSRSPRHHGDLGGAPASPESR